MKEGRKNDRLDDKLRWELLPLDVIEEVVRVYHEGAKKYEENTWQNLDDGYRRYKAALFRHLLLHEKGELRDPENGCLHIAQMCWNAIAMVYYVLRDINEKDTNNDNT